MDKQQIIDLMANRDYALYTDTGGPIIFFRHMKWTKLSAQVNLDREVIQFRFLTQVGVLLTVESQGMLIEEARTVRRNEAAMIRAMINLRVGK